MIWSKTYAGRTELQTRVLAKERTQRHLLLPVDGVKTEALLMSSIDGATPTTAFVTALAIERAGTSAELPEVADRVLKRILDREGPGAAEKVRTALHG